MKFHMQIFAVWDELTSDDCNITVAFGSGGMLGARNFNFSLATSIETRSVVRMVGSENGRQ